MFNIQNDVIHMIIYFSWLETTFLCERTMQADSLSSSDTLTFSDMRVISSNLTHLPILQFQDTTLLEI